MSESEKELRKLVREKMQAVNMIAEIQEEQVKPLRAKIRAIDKRMAVVAAEG